MALKRNNGTADIELNKFYRNDGTTNKQIGKIYTYDGTANHLIYSAESDVITLTGTVTQGTVMQWKNVDYKITEDWTTMTITDSSWGKAYGNFETAIQLIEGSTKTNLVDRQGSYTGYPESVAAETIVASGTQYTVKKGQTIRLAVGASYNPNVSGQGQTTSWVSFKLS